MIYILTFANQVTPQIELKKGAIVLMNAYCYYNNKNKADISKPCYTFKSHKIQVL